MNNFKKKKRCPEDVDVLEFLMEHSLPHENWVKF